MVIVDEKNIAENGVMSMKMKTVIAIAAAVSAATGLDYNFNEEAKSNEVLLRH